MKKSSFSIRKTLIVFLAFLLPVICAVPSQAAVYKKIPAMTEPSADTKALKTSWQEIVEKSLVIMQKNEGNYTTVDGNDNGALSIGFIQWHAQDALTLLRYVVSLDNETAKDLLGNSLYKEITAKKTNWDRRTLTLSEVYKVKAVLNTKKNPVSKTAQDQMAKSYLLSYLNHGTALGITNPAALVYYCDLENQGGYGGAKKCAGYASSYAGEYSKITLNDMLMGAVYYPPFRSYKTRRLFTYSYCMQLGWSYKRKSDLQIACASAGNKNTQEGIRWLQTTLNLFYDEIGYTGYKIDVNGSYDKATGTAVSRFQKLASLAVDGDAGYKTVFALLYDQIAAKLEKKKLSAYLDLPKTMPDEAKGTADSRETEEEKKTQEASAEKTAQKKKKTSLKLVKKKYKLRVGAKAFKIRTTGGNGKKITYKSSNKKVAGVSKKGVVRVKKAGKATITVRQGKQKLKVKITVR